MSKVTNMNEMFDDEIKLNRLRLPDDTPKGTREELMTAALSRLEERVRQHTPQNAKVLQRVRRRQAMFKDRVQNMNIQSEAMQIDPVSEQS
jgi:biotin-(acetyl-CoA carboxylase) ligase